MFEDQGRYGAAVASKEEALKAFRDLNNRTFWIGEILSGYRMHWLRQRRGKEAEKSLDEAMTLARELKNDALVAQVLNFQGDVAFLRDDLTSAPSVYNQALQAASRSKDRRRVLLSRVDVTKVAVEEGVPEKLSMSSADWARRQTR